MSEEMKNSIRSIYKTVNTGNIKSLLSLFMEDSRLVWESFTFTGTTKIEGWAIGLREMFTELNYIEDRLEVKGQLADHLFTIAVATREGRRGMIRCRALYKFTNNKILDCQISILAGILILDQENLKILGF
jgi:hypothetical protein